MFRRKHSTEEIAMHTIREILRLAFNCEASGREIARSTRKAPSTIQKYLNQAQKHQLTYPQIQTMDDAALKKLLQCHESKSRSKTQRPLPDWSELHLELKKKSVTLQLLWEEYRERHPANGYELSQFYLLYRKWKKTLAASMRQTHKAGEKMFVDYAGQTVPIIDKTTGQKDFDAQIFVAVLGASNYTFGEATRSQTLGDWTHSHVHAFEYFDGAPEAVVPDNLRTGVSKACFYEPDLNRSYQELADHYNTVILPARVRKPKDKAKVENAVLVVERWILARLRNRTFFSLEALNSAICELLEDLNHRAFKKLPGSRRSQFEALDKPALQPLPQNRYIFAEWKKVRMHIDYHVEFERHYYSAPHVLIGKQLDLRSTANTVEIFYNHRRVASHRRSYQQGAHTAVPEHRPKSHQKYLEWTPERLIRWAHSIGPATAELAEKILRSRPHPEMGYRSCLGIFRLAKSYSNSRLEAACNRALAIGASSYKSVQSILKNGLDKETVPSQTPPAPANRHGNVRGQDYFSL